MRTSSKKSFKTLKEAKEYIKLSHKDKRIFNRSEACEVLNITNTTLSRLRNNGEIETKVSEHNGHKLVSFSFAELAKLLFKRGVKL